MARHAFSIAPALAAAIIATGFTGCVTAPDTPPPASNHAEAPSALEYPLSMDTAVRHALAVEPSIRAARHEVSAAYWDTLQASLPANPAVGVSLDSDWSVSLAGMVSDWMDLGGQRSHRVAAAQSREEHAALEVMRREAEVVHAVRSAFAEAVTRRELEALYTERLELLEQVLEIERQRLAWGDLSELALIRLEREWVEARVAPEDEAMRRRQAEARLNRYLGLPLREPLELAQPFDMDEAWPAPVEGEDVDLGMVRRPELAMLTAKLAEHEAELSLARVAWLPDAEAGPIFEWPRGDGASYGGGFVSITLPIFDHGQARRGAAREQMQALEQTMLAAQAEVLLEVHEALLRLRHAEDRLTIDWREEHQRAARQRVVTEQLADAGAASQVDALMSRVHELNARIALAEARGELWRARIDLAAAMGNPMAANPGHATNGTDTHGEA